ncbi:hypothetical protein GCM10009119_24680 [Algoriphagus jejuensis]|uniref:DUF2490 domain-containing protein n=2 Tax=Algoriphagus jejuensis TaxID=419934 RepID=A0ABP3YDI9_9BACT
MIAAVSLLSTSAFAQKNVISSNQVWIQSYHEGRISEKWNVLLDGGFRWRDGFDNKSAYIIRGAMGYSLSSKLRVSGGLAYLGVYEREKIVRHEYRPHQEILHKSAWGKVKFSNRLRIEERFFKDEVLDAATVDFNFRFRYALMVSIPVANLSTKDPTRKMLLNIGNEIFLNAGKEVTDRVFDQNRLVFSPTLQWSENLSISLTYNSQYASTVVPDNFLQSRVYWLQIRHNLDFRDVSKK